MTRDEAEKIINEIGIGYFEDVHEEQQNYNELVEALLKADAEGYRHGIEEATEMVEKLSWDYNSIALADRIRRLRKNS